MTTKKELEQGLLIRELKKENLRLQKKIAKSQAQDLSAKNKLAAERPLPELSKERLREIIAMLPTKLHEPTKDT
jgi:hypothetical protein